jgi:hypothetical protein
MYAIIDSNRGDAKVGDASDDGIDQSMMHQLRQNNTVKGNCSTAISKVTGWVGGMFAWLRLAAGSSCR